MQNIYEAQTANKIKSTLVVVFFFVFVAFVIYTLGLAFSYNTGSSIGGLGIAGFALILSGILSFSGYYFSDKIVLGISGAREASRTRDFDFYTVAENLSIGAGLPKPKLYVIDDTAMNAFATGRDPAHSVVCATRGLLDKLTRSELEGVIAHELTHVKNYDIRLMSIVSVLVGSVALLGDLFLRVRFRGSKSDNDSGQLGAIIMVVGILLAILSPFIAQLIQLAVSRRREFFADSGSVAITRNPQGLIAALTKISNDHEPLEAANKATAHLYIANPFKDKTNSAVGWFAGLFNTHPPVMQRLAALQKMS